VSWPGSKRSRICSGKRSDASFFSPAVETEAHTKSKRDCEQASNPAPCQIGIALSRLFAINFARSFHLVCPSTIPSKSL